MTYHPYHPYQNHFFIGLTLLKMSYAPSSRKQYNNMVHTLLNHQHIKGVCTLYEFKILQLDIIRSLRNVIVYHTVFRLQWIMYCNCTRVGVSRYWLL